MTADSIHNGALCRYGPTLTAYLGTNPHGSQHNSAHPSAVKRYALCERDGDDVRIIDPKAHDPFRVVCPC